MTEPSPQDQPPGLVGQPPAGAAGQPPTGATGDAPGSVWQPAAGGPPAPPALSLPKGGGAIRDIGEKITVDPATGMASLTVPVAISPGRASSGPSLSISYNSGAGNSAFGLGWKISLPAITRKTDKGLPRYLDDPDQDTFILSGAEDLVPLRAERDGTWEQAPERRTVDGRLHSVQRYRPRIESLFARIERWRDLGSGETHWRSITPANVTTIYGGTPGSRIADPDDPARVFSWLICASYDDTGNATTYDYAAEDGSGVDTSLASERNRSDRARSAGRYPKRIRYGNRVPCLAAERHPGPGQADDAGWMFEVVFDYGDHEGDAPGPDASRAWPCRPDPFSTYRPGFEVRTYRRCHRILMFHDFPGEPGVGTDCLVGSTDLTYLSTGGSGMTTVASVTRTGYRRQPGGGYRKASLPPLEFGYSQAVIGHEPRDLDPEALQNLPAGIDGSDYRWIDLDGDGLSGILARQGGAWYYRANLGEGRFAPVRALVSQPAMAAPGRRQELLDLDGSGHLDLVELGGQVPGFYERTGERGWRSFRPFASHPDIAWDDPDLRLVDLDGDGLADVLITRDDAFTWYPSFGLEGFGGGRQTFQPWDEELGPRVMFADPEQTVYLADMTGDGLSDLVRVRNGEICYWPNTGFARFGAKVTMDRSPWLDESGLFDQRRVRLADVDGSGAMDLVYLHPGGVRLYLNQSGNGFGEPHTLPQGFPQLDTAVRMMVADLLGKGTACLVWSSPLPSDSGRQVRYIDLMTAGKPYLLTEVVNNLGAETRISYAPSTRFYLADQAAGHPWITRLPFPVQVVERVETVDRINRNRFTTKNAYHHGYYDGFEREFRGFGMVEQWDTEELAVLEADGARGEFTNLNQGSDVPPTLTRTWLHTGVFPGEGRVTRLYAHEYYRQPGGGDPDLPDTALPSTLRLTGERPRRWQLSGTEAREACRALKGSPIRQEVYALDRTEAQNRPYGVTEYNYTIELLQPATAPRPDGPQNYHAVFLTHARETVTAHYERSLYSVEGKPRADPRITHEMVFAVDDYGNPLSLASAGYGREFPDPVLAEEDRDAQRKLRLTHTVNRYTNPVELPRAYRTPRPAETRTFEVLGLRPGGRSRLFGFAELRDKLASVQARLPFWEWDADPAELSQPAFRLLSRSHIRYRRDDLSGPLPVGVLEPLALPYRSYRAAFTDDLVDDLYGGSVNPGLLTAAGYVADGGTWWLPSGRVFYSPDGDDDAEAELDYTRRHFFLPRRFSDPFGNTTLITYDDYDLLISESRDALGNLVSAGERDTDDRLVADGNDYRVLQPRLVSDPNRNQVAAAFDILGHVCGTAVMGKPGELLGDSLGAFDPDPELAAVVAYFADPFAGAHRLLGTATTRVLYDLGAYRRSRHQPHPNPPGIAVLIRETHVSELAPGQHTRIQRSFAYSDGFGRVVQHKGQAAPGPTDDDEPDVEHRWIGSGWTVFDNKGQPVRTYEPFFTATPRFEFARTSGVSAVVFYDPVGRVVAILHPDDTYEKTVFDPWHHDTWDANDTVLLDPRYDPDVAGYVGRYLTAMSEQEGGWTTWYARRIGGALGRAQHRAAEQTAPHAGTPTRAWMDTLGRAFLSVAHNRVTRHGSLTDVYCPMHSRLDIQGNEHERRDGLGRAVMRYRYMMLSANVNQVGMDAGRDLLLPDVSGKPVHVLSSRGFSFRMEYDALRRPVRTYVTGPGLADQVLQTRTQYGEGLPDAEAGNLRARIARQYDSPGVVVNEAYDFKGNLLSTRRQLAAEYRGVVDWASDVPLEDRDYLASTSYDALNRPISSTAPDGSVLLLSYNPAGLLDRLDGRLPGTVVNTTFAERLDYNARGQRTLICYGNGSVTSYAYDPLTFRLVRLMTRRRGRRLQDLRHTYDPVGHPTLVRDDAQQRTFFRNQVASPSASYTYDALYQLIRATGREHVRHAAGDSPGVRLPLPGDGTAMSRYAERYTYDLAGNLLRMAHRSADPAAGGWIRDYRYHEASLIEPERYSNRLTSTGTARSITQPQAFRYDEHGNTTAMPGIRVLHWDADDRLHMTADESGDHHEGQEASYYVYDTAGQRVRHVTQRTARGGQATRKSERIYVGGFEVYREYGTDGTLTLERDTLHVLDGTRRMALVETRTLGTDRGPGELVRYQLADLLDSSVLELDQQARVISYEEYYPYGGSSYQAVRSQTEVPKRYRFTGKERDTETGLYYYGARYYAPWLGRWIAIDPIAATPTPYKQRSENNKGDWNGISGNPYQYALNRPTALVDPDGYDEQSPSASGPSLRETTAVAHTSAADPAAPAATAARAKGTAPSASTAPAVPGSEGKPVSAGASEGGVFGAIAGALRAAGNWIRQWVPGLIAAPLAGLLDALAGFTGAVGGIFSWKGKDIVEGLKDMSLGVLSMVGLKEVVADKWVTREEVPELTTGDLAVPKTLAKDLVEGSRVQQKIAPDAAENGMHAWHAATNANVINRLGPVMAPLLWLAGLIHETPIDWRSFKAEQRAQGTVNHILDSLTDIVANTWGILLGLLLPRKVAVKAAAFTGDYIPGPADRDPTGAGVGGYKGNPTDAWGPYFKKKGP